ncbi:MAG: alpha/beta hydrolase [Anaerovoracaceae bacterium]
MASLRYRTVRKIMEITGGMKGMCRASVGRITAAARRAACFARVPSLSSDELDIETVDLDGQKVVTMRHRRAAGPASACLYLIGRGMIFYPRGEQVKQAVKIAEATGRDLIVPYYPLCVDKPVTRCYEWLGRLYEKMLEEYEPERIAFSGSSSGGSLALGMISDINQRGAGVPMPERVYAASPGECFRTDEIRENAERLKKHDFILDPAYMKKEELILTHGRKVPEFMLYQDAGDYRGLSRAYICYADDEVLYALCGPITDRLKADGVDVTVEIGEGLFHCYPFSTGIPDARQGWENMISFLRADAEE